MLFFFTFLEGSKKAVSTAPATLNNLAHFITFFMPTFFALVAKSVCTAYYSYWAIHFKAVAFTESTEVPKLKTLGQKYHA